MAKEEDIGKTILAGMFIVGLVVLLIQKIFTVMLIITPVVLIFLVISMFIDKDELFQSGSASFYLGIIFLVCLAVFCISYLIGYGLGGTSLGQACVGTYQSISGGEQEVAVAFDEATSQLIAETCEVVDEASCDLLKSSAKAGKTIQELEGIASKFEKVSRIAK